MIADLRRIPRVSVCARAVVQDRYGVWTGVTDDICARGCQIVTNRLLRVGAGVQITLSSDLFPDELEVRAQVVWSAPDRLGLIFLETTSRAGAIAPEAWMEKVLEHGATDGAAPRLVPSVHRGAGRVFTTTAARNGRLVRTAPTPDPELRPVQPARHG
jgi:hypothetical protein